MFKRIHLQSLTLKSPECKQRYVQSLGIWNKSNKKLAQCSENSIQQKRLHTSVNNVVLLFSCGYSYHFSEQCGTFFSYGDRFLSSYNYCIQWNLNPTKTSSHFSEQGGTYFQLWRQIPLQWTMWYFFYSWRQITQPL